MAPSLCRRRPFGIRRAGAQPPLAPPLRPTAEATVICNRGRQGRHHQGRRGHRRRCQGRRAPSIAASHLVRRRRLVTVKPAAASRSGSLPASPHHRAPCVSRRQQ
uniref:Uncharacterized protein n=1 Tax=Oryza sativa subsp. japonica TaxID=39947 RepID=Q6EU60_ORYSJ|nr:hypothetical protein [Oryza sativa Japonica Group]